MTKKISSFLILFIAGFFVMGVTPALAQTTSTGDFGLSNFGENLTLGQSSLPLIIARVINIFLGLLGIIVTGIFLYAGYLWMMSGGSEDQIATAKSLMRNCVIGLAIILSSFAISSFIISRLEQATGTQIGNLSANCADPQYASEHPNECNEFINIDCQDDGYRADHPEQCEEQCDRFGSLCYADRFYVRSITPATNNTGMANVAIKIIFSLPIQTNTAVADIVRITRDGNDVTDQMQIHAFASEGRAVWIDAGTNVLFPAGTYRITVDEDLSSTDGKTLETPTIGGVSYPLEATFTIGAGSVGVRDTVYPTTTLLRATQGGVTRNVVPTGVGIPLFRRSDVVDFAAISSDVSGVSVGRLRVGTTTQPFVGAQIYSTFLDGPTVARGSDAPASNPFSYAFPVFFSRATPVPALYWAGLDVWDIDSNSRVRTGNFVLVGEQCDPATGAPTSPSSANECLSETVCEYNWQCVSQRCDTTRGQCINAPVITDVSPWDGASGNWITVSGMYFGSDPGTVQFGRDNNNDGTIDGWVVATQPAACEGDDIWNDSWVIAEVPNDTSLPQNGRYAIRVVRADVSSYTNPLDAEDTTINNRGPQPGEGTFEGWFTKNTTNRPGLCSVKGDLGQGQWTGSVVAPSETKVRARGASFGTTPASIFFGGSVPAPVFDWANVSIGSQVPQGMNAGKVSVQVQDARGERSNGVPFTISAVTASTTPIIEGIDPSETTRGTFITIRGQYFGAQTGEVWAAQDTATALACARHDGSVPESDCYLLDASGFSQCTNTWSDTQIIGYIDEDMPTSSYAVVVRTYAVEFTDGQDRLTVIDGPPRPSICSLDPITGPAPLGAGNPGLDIKGIHFSANPTAYFWKRGAGSSLSTWLSSVSLLAGQFAGSDTVIRTQIPMVGGVSMDTGPIRVVDAAGLQSNPVTYTVLDCRAYPSSAPGNNFACCQEGPDAGLWKQSGFACAGETRDAGYVWRFTSGKIPKVPYVVESCDESGWQVVDGGPGVAYPSPIPWMNWSGGDSTCLNANISVRFSMPMVSDPTVTSSVRYPGNVELYKCTEQQNGDIVCNTEVTEALDLEYESEVLTIWNGSDRNLAPNTWYRVVLSDEIMGREQVSVAGVLRDVYTPLRRSRPCGDGTAYCYDFQTGDIGEQCVLSNASIHPAGYTTNTLGPIRTVFDQLYYFFVWGRADQTCVVLDVDGLGWNWTEQDPTKVTSDVAPSDRYEDSRAQADAWMHTAPSSSPIYAVVSFSTTTDGVQSTTTLRATSQITVDLGGPHVVDFWQNCTEACINTGIGARFNRQMDIESYADGFIFRSCLDGETCQRLSSPLMMLGIDTQLSDSRTLVANLTGANVLATSTWYKVTLTDDIYSIGGYDRDQDLLRGEPLQVFEWKFKTKSDNTPCVASSVTINPLSYVESVVGNAKLFRSSALGSPDTCSAAGQVLNPWGFDWSWRSLDTAVATISNFELSGTHAPWCTTSCVPAGSDIPCADCFTTTSPAAVVSAMCGNGVINQGEECDIGMAGEIAGQSCGYTCLRPGNVDTNTCGNGVLDKNLGEQCDPYRASNTSSIYVVNGATVSGPDGFCSNTCTLTGASSEATGDVAAPVCGSGAVTAGEQCEGGAAQGCTDMCVFVGTPLLQAYCDRSDVDETRVAACSTASSVCGNAILESGEECEVGMAGATASTCSNRCTIIGDVCDTPLSQCTKGSAGCSAQCTREGSSINNPIPSFCGDGVTGQGEYTSAAFGSCDVGGNNFPLGLPVQAATAVGRSSDIDPLTQAMFTQIEATIVGYATGTTTANLTTDQRKNGQAEYYLQCGFVEYTEPVNGRLNNCAEPTHGVGDNTCCYPRPVAVSQYPASLAGLGVPPLGGVCRNTFIEVTYDAPINEETLENNIVIAEMFQGASCPAGQRDVSNLIDDSFLSYATIDTPAQERGFFGRIWDTVRSFFGRIFGEPVFAVTNLVWCDSNIRVDARVADATANSSRVVVYLQSLLKENTIYTVLMEGGAEGIKDTFGVSIAGSSTDVENDGWVFRTGSDICKLKDVVVTPSSYLFTGPYTTTTFNAVGNSINGQMIVSIPAAYEWTWKWVPAQNPLFDVPVANTPSNTPAAIIGARNLEGELSVYAQATVVADVDQSATKHTGKIFSGKTDLYADFCENIWPPRNAQGLWAPFEDADYHFRFDYCADAGQSGTREDDLPYFSITRADELGVGVLPAADTLRRYIMFNDTNDDVISVQVLRNTERISLDEWYGSRFGNLSSMKKISVDGYEGLTDGSNYYIAALNEVGVPSRVLYNNVYLFSLSQGAQADSKRVLEAILESLVYNTNIPEKAYCLPPSMSLVNGDVAPIELSCQTDFDCRDAAGIARDTTGDGVADTSGICGNGRTKLRRDLQRLNDVQRAQNALFNYKNANGDYPTLGAGTYIGGYTNSMWPSWQGTFGTDLRVGIPVDPLNTWSQCPAGTDARTCWEPTQGKYFCPAVESVYEYYFDPSTSTQDYTLYAQFEYLTTSGATIGDGSGNTFINRFIDSEHFVDGRWCEPGVSISPFGEQCGDGVIQVGRGEVCELGQTRIVSCGSGSSRGEQSQVCTSSCSGWVNEGACVLNQQCGNGVVEGAEACDDGAGNGQYGQCNNTCTGASGQYCGNGALDGNGLEYCDENAEGICQFVTGNGAAVRPEVLIVLDRSATMRACLAASGTTTAACGNWANSKWRQTINALTTLNTQHADDVDFYVLEVPGATPDQCSLYQTSLASYLAQTPGPAESASNSRIVPAAAGMPIGNALLSVATNPGSYFPRNSASKYVYLITDGNITGVSGSGVCTDGLNTTASVAAQVVALRDKDVTTYVFGIGNIPNTAPTTLWGDQLNSIARASGIVDTVDPTADYFKVTNSTTLSARMNETLGCNPYSLSENTSCSLDCQAPGAYCGDGKVDALSGEQCDDANTNPLDGCTNYCTFPQTAAPPIIASVSVGSCGNNIVDTLSGEVCDTGTSTLGIAPDPSLIPYGETRTYCSADCKAVLTVDSAAYCGNGIVDWNDTNKDGIRQSTEALFEICDATQNGVTTSTDGTILPVCDNVRGSACTNACQTFVPSACIQCGVFPANQIPVGVPSADLRLALTHGLTLAGTNNSNQFANWTINTSVHISDIVGPARSTYTLPARSRLFLNTPFDRIPVFDPTATVPMRLVTDPLCSEEYVVSFNDTALGTTPGTSSTIRDSFPLRVNGATTTMLAEFTYVPVPPRNGYTFIARVKDWEQPDGNNVIAMPLYYLTREAFASSLQMLPADITFDTQYAAWIPANMPDYLSNYESYGLKTTSMWLGNAMLRGSSEPEDLMGNLLMDFTTYTSQLPVAVYVAIAPSGDNISIEQMKAQNISFEVYSNRNGQNPELSVYGPSRTYSLSNAVVDSDISTGSSHGLYYWHVFNLIHDGDAYTIVPPTDGNQDGTIHMTSCEVRDGIPGDRCP